MTTLTRPHIVSPNEYIAHKVFVEWKSPHGTLDYNFGAIVIHIYCTPPFYTYYFILYFFCIASSRSASIPRVWVLLCRPFSPRSSSRHIHLSKEKMSVELDPPEHLEFNRMLAPAFCRSATLFQKANLCEFRTIHSTSDTVLESS